MTDDSQLLRRYTEEGSEAAFTELVSRHVNLVYSAALRQVAGDFQLAQDVTQGVFADLARNAGNLWGRKTITGWLYTSTRFAAAKVVRTEQRRRAREQKAIEMHDSTFVSNSDWEKLSLLLDEGMHHLSERDREAVLLRYFENKEFKLVGESVGLSENAVRMRVERALEKLRTFFKRRGV